MRSLANPAARTKMAIAADMIRWGQPIDLTCARLVPTAESLHRACARHELIKCGSLTDPPGQPNQKASGDLLGLSHLVAVRGFAWHCPHDATPCVCIPHLL